MPCTARALQVPVPEVVRQGPRIVPLVGQLVAAGMAQHVGMNREAEARCLASSLNHT